MNIGPKSNLPISGVLVVLLLSLTLLASCGLFSSTADLKWNVNQVKPLIQATDCCGFVPQIVPFNYIPSAQLWGDGTLIWTERDDDGKRSVLRASLSQNEIGSLLKEFSQVGFFTWQDEYADHRIADIPWTCIHIDHKNDEKSVCEYYQGAPADFHVLYDRLENGLQKTGAPFVPERGLLKSYRMDGIGFSDTPPTPWLASGVSLADAEQGIWVEGDALEAAWEIINKSTWGNWVEFEGAVYQLTLQIPGISMIDPEAAQ